MKAIRSGWVAAAVVGAVWTVLLLGLVGPAAAQVTNTWTAGAGAWTNGDNWSEGLPVAGQHVAVTAAGANVLLTEPTPELASFTLTRTLTFTNWNSVLTATNIQIKTGATVTLPPAFTDSVPQPSVKSGHFRDLTRKLNAPGERLL